MLTPSPGQRLPPGLDGKYCRKMMVYLGYKDMPRPLGRGKGGGRMFGARLLSGHFTDIPPDGLAFFQRMCEVICASYD